MSVSTKTKLYIDEEIKKREYVRKEVAAHYNAVVEYIGSRDAVLGVFAYGSMNYGTFELGRSDVDTKAIIIPSFDNCLFDRPISKTLKIDDAHCEVKDIRLMVDCYKKQNLNFVETLFTPFNKINPEYETLWNSFFVKNAERIAHYNEDRCVHSMAAMCLNILNDTDEWNGKNYANVLRLLNFLETYCIDRLTYPECIRPYELDKIKQIKYSTEPCLTSAEINNMYDTAWAYLNREPDKYKYVNVNIDHKLDTMLNMSIKNLILARIL